MHALITVQRALFQSPSRTCTLAQERCVLVGKEMPLRVLLKLVCVALCSYSLLHISDHTSAEKDYACHKKRRYIVLKR